MTAAGGELHRTIDAIYRAESGAVLATLIRLLGGFEPAEEALHDAFAAAMEQWHRDGVPDNPRSWLISTGRFKAIDRMRRSSRFRTVQGELARQMERDIDDEQALEPDEVEDDRLRLIFTCCHPALPGDAQVALTLREVCGLTTEEIASAFLTVPATVAQRIVRAKRKIRAAGIPYEVPAQAELPERLENVLRVVYLVFNEGYSASAGESLTRPDISGEAIRLGRLLVQLLPEPEALGLLALMLLNDSRRAARTSPDGELVLLDEQDRSVWNRTQIEEGAALVRQACCRSGSGLIRCKPRSPPCTPRRRTLRQPTGRRSSACTACSYRSPRHPWSSSTARWQWPCWKDRKPVCG
jgi:RNA polymerase sigma-70 factor (ECF subfamily)